MVRVRYGGEMSATVVVVGQIVNVQGANVLGSCVGHIKPQQTAI